jgi:K+:H+ antiporter
VAPFRDLFAVMFFVAIGTVIDPRAIPDALPWLGVVLGLVLFAKVGIIFVLGTLLRLRQVHNWQLAIGLGQIGEFSFVLGAVGVTTHVISSQLYTALLTTVAVSIAVSAVAVRVRPAAVTRT